MGRLSNHWVLGTVQLQQVHEHKFSTKLNTFTNVFLFFYFFFILILKQKGKLVI